MRNGIVWAAIGRETVVNMKHALVGNHISRNAPSDADCAQAFAIDQPFDFNFAGLILSKSLQQWCGFFNCILTHPVAGGVCSLTEGTEFHSQISIAAALDSAITGFAQNCEVCVEKIRAHTLQHVESIELSIDLFVVVPHIGHVVLWICELKSQFELHCNARFHVDGAASPQIVNTVLVFESGRHIVVNRHRVDVACQNHPLRSTEVRASNDGVTMPRHFEVIARSNLRLDRICEWPFVARNTVNIAQLTGNADNVFAEVELDWLRCNHESSLGRYAGTMSDSSRWAWGFGLATTSRTGTVLDTWFPHPELGRMPEGRDPWIAPADIEALAGADERREVTINIVNVEIDLDAPPASTSDAYLRLHLLSHLLVLPNSINLDGIFGKLPNVIWTNAGPVAVEDYDRLRPTLSRHGISAHSLDKFPRLIDYVTPAGVRIADVNRVRLGAYLSSGTTVMHEGFVNFNAGTLGSSMVEGRISQGVVVGDGADIGGGASIMGTLSGGGTQRVAIGARALLGANSGVGISIGDDCIVEAGLYVTAGTKVLLPKNDSAAGEPDSVKASELSGVPNILFRRNSVTGAVEALPRTGSGIALNPDLHA